MPWQRLIFAVRRCRKVRSGMQNSDWLRGDGPTNPANNIQVVLLFQPVASRVSLIRKPSSASVAVNPVNGEQKLHCWLADVKLTSNIADRFHLRPTIHPSSVSFVCLIKQPPLSSLFILVFYLFIYFLTMFCFKLDGFFCCLYFARTAAGHHEGRSHGVINCSTRAKNSIF